MPTDYQWKGPQVLLEKVLKLYVAGMEQDVRSPTPHLFGPPGCGKSTVVEQAAHLLNVNLHTINVSRISPLELEGIQMPNKTNTELSMLTATFWTSLKEGDILLLDEFLRGFPEVYNGLLDILTSRRVGLFQLPKVFIIAASNSTVSYDVALEDRLLHIKVPDIRKDKSEAKQMRKRIVEYVGLYPDMASSPEMDALMTNEVMPMYSILDKIGTSRNSSANGEGSSIRKLIGQAQLREVMSSDLRVLIEANNRRAINEKKLQYLVLLSGSNVAPATLKELQEMVSILVLTDQQRRNIRVNIQLIEAEQIHKEREQEHDSYFVNSA
jgi:hypothetical protein